MKLVFRGEFVCYKNMIRGQKTTDFGKMKNKMVLKLGEGEFAGLETVNKEAYNTSLKCNSDIGVVLEVSLEALGDKIDLVEPYLREIKAKKELILRNILERKTQLKEKNQLSFSEINLKNKIDFACKKPDFIKKEVLEEFVRKMDREKKQPKSLRMPLKMEIKHRNKVKIRIHHRETVTKKVPRLRKEAFDSVSTEITRSNRSKEEKSRAKTAKEVFFTRQKRVIPANLSANLKGFSERKPEKMFNSGAFEMPMISLVKEYSE